MQRVGETEGEREEKAEREERNWRGLKGRRSTKEAVPADPVHAEASQSPQWATGTATAFLDDQIDI